MLRHVKEHVKHPRQPAVASHATNVLAARTDVKASSSQISRIATSFDDVLVGKRDRRHLCLEPGANKVGDDSLWREAKVHWWSPLCLGPEINNDQYSTRSERRRKVACVTRPRGYVMPDMHDQDRIDAVRCKSRGRAHSTDRAEIRKLLSTSAIFKVSQHVRLEIRRDHLAVRDSAREPHREVPGSRADIGDGHGRLEVESTDHVVGLLP